MNLGLSGWTQREQRIDKRSGIRESECKKKPGWEHMELNYSAIN